MMMIMPKRTSMGRNRRFLIIMGSKRAVQRVIVAMPIMQMETFATLTALKKVSQ